MLKIKRYLFTCIALFIIFPLLTSAATELGASTQSPVVGSNFYVQLDVNYGTKLEIRDLHVVITYDKSYLKLDDVVWLQSRGSYRDDNGTIYLDKETSRNWISGATVQFKFTALKDGTSSVKIRANGDSHYANGDVIGQTFAPVSISAVKPSSSTLIGSLYVKGYTILPTFSKTTYSYNLVVPSDVTSVEVVGTKSDSRQQITGTGVKTLRYGDNRVRVTVTAQDGSSRTYEIMIHRTDDRTGDTSLKNLTVTNTSLKYVENQTTYETTVSRSVDKLLINAVTTDPKATLVGTGEKNLNIGENKFILSVESSGGKKTDYTIIIHRSTEELNVVTESSKLQSLRVNNLGLDLRDNKTKWLYGITNDIDYLNINATPESTTAEVEIIGNANLKEGINVITIKVTETKGENIDEVKKDQNSDDRKNQEYDVTEYTLIVYKNPSNATLINDLNNPGTGNLVYNTTSSNPTSIPANIIESLKKNNTKLYYDVVNNYNGLLYQAILKNNLPDGAVDATFSKTADSPLTYKTTLPKGTEITLYLEDYFLDGASIKIYTYNESGQYTLLTDGIKIKNGYITFTTNGEQNYVFTTSTLIKEQSPFEKIVNKYKNIFIGGIAFLILIILCIRFITKKIKQKEKNEPLY